MAEPFFNQKGDKEMSFGTLPTMTVLRRKAKVRINTSDYNPETDEIIEDAKPEPTKKAEAPAKEPEKNEDDDTPKATVAKGPFGKWYIHDADGNRQPEQFKTKKEAEAALTAENG